MHADLLDHLADLMTRDPPGRTKMVFIGSDVEVAGRVREDSQRAYGEVLHAEGRFWRYGESHWESIPEHQLRLAVHDYDGAFFKTPSGEPSRVKLSKSRVDSVLNELAALVAQPLFREHHDRHQLRLGLHSLRARRHSGSRAARSRSPLPPHASCHWSPGTAGAPPEDSLLAQLLGGVFLGDDDAEAKVALLAEIIGAAALGYATRLRQPRAVILKGETAENGKSQILDLARACCRPRPSAR